MSGVIHLPEDALRRLQLILLDMLLELDRICRKYDIKYTIVAGTLLGAVRHGGFIPWDDDIDVAMLREDYIQFREVCKTELDSKKYFFQDDKSDSGYRWGYARIRRLGTEFVREGQEHLTMKTGMFIDIFPSDNIPDFYPARLMHCFECFVLRKILYSEVGKRKEKSRIKRTVYLLLNHVPKEYVFRRFDKMSKQWNKRRTKYNRTLAFPPRAGFWLGTPRIWDEEVTEILFEGHWFFTTAHYKTYLAWRYGDYMQLPPPEKRHWHQATKIVFPEE